MLNRVSLIGNLGRDPEVRRLESGIAVAKFSIATNENYKDKNGEWQKLTEWHDIVAWRGLAEMAENRLKKGGMVYLEGKLTHRKYQDKEGKDRYITEVVANVIRMLDRKPEGGGTFGPSMPSANDAPPAYGNSNSSPAESTSNPAAKAPDTVADAPDDDLPF